MSDSDKPGRAEGEEAVSGPESTRREFLGTTAGAGIASKLWGMSKSDPSVEGEAVGDDRGPAAIEADLSEQEGIFNIKDYGAVGDGDTNSTEPIYEAINDAAEVGGTVLFPVGDWVSDWIILRHEHNGVTLTGLGFGSRIIPLQAVHPEDAWTWKAYGGDDPILDIDPTHFAFTIQLNDNFSPPRPHPASLPEAEGEIEEGLNFNAREAKAYKDITIKNLRLDGQQWRDHIVFDPFGDRDDRTGVIDGGRGITTSDQGDEVSEDILIKNIWSHDWNSNGIRVSTGGTTVDQCYLNRNNFHGLAAGSGTSPSPALVTNIHAIENGFYGIDTGGSTNVNNFVCRNNGWGVKINGGPHMFTNGSIYNSGKLDRHFRTGGVGLQAVSGASQVYLDNVETRASDRTGFRFNRMDEVKIGRITSIDDDENGNTPGGIQIKDCKDLQANQIVVQSSAGNGVTLQDTGSVRINDLVAENNDGVGLRHPGGTDELVLKGGIIRNNEDSGLDIQGGDRTVLRDLRVEDDRDDPTQTVGVDLGSEVGDVLIDGLDLRNSPVAIQIPDEIHPTVENVAGFVTENSGRATFESGGYEKTNSIEHGLSEAPERVQITPDVSTNATEVVGVKDLSEDTFQFEFRNVPKGPDDDAAVFWEASVY